MRIAEALFAVLLVGLVAALAGISMLVSRIGVHRRARAAATRLRLNAQEAEQAALRHLGLAAHELRGIGMTLHGHADHLAQAAHPHAAGIATAAADLLDIADNIQDCGLEGDPRVLREEPLSLGFVLEEAITTVASAIVPGRRAFRVAASVDGIRLRADNRALRHILTRVLADAVRSTRQDDWIDISAQRNDAEMSVIFADEGTGLHVTSDHGPRTTQNTRGMTLRMTLARALMAAHGGRIEIEAKSGVGTRVSLIFPLNRVRMPPLPAPSQKAA